MLLITSKVDKKVIRQWCGGGVVYLTDNRTTPGCSTLFNSVQLWIVAISGLQLDHQGFYEQLMLCIINLKW